MSINNKYAEYVESLTVKRPLPSLQERYITILDVTEEYYADTGKTLPHHLLTMLSDWYLADELGNKDKYKMERIEYPILTNTQEKRRRRRVVHLDGDLLDYFKAVKNSKVKAGKANNRECDKE